MVLKGLACRTRARPATWLPVSRILMAAGPAGGHYRASATLLVARIPASHLDQILFIAAHSDRAGAEPHSDPAPADDRLTIQRRGRRTPTGTAPSRVAVTKDQS